ncbi:MAG: hypothetical protein MZW92_25355, partial [Comamonadaceae bacterium]|nr:hypothetical protein [Comamonadaceae bacterium]
AMSSLRLNRRLQTELTAPDRRRHDRRFAAGGVACRPGVVDRGERLRHRRRGALAAAQQARPDRPQRRLASRRPWRMPSWSSSPRRSARMGAVFDATRAGAAGRGHCVTDVGSTKRDVVDAARARAARARSPLRAGASDRRQGAAGRRARRCGACTPAAR